MKSMNGKWAGQYTYGEGYPDLLVGRSVAFELVLTGNGVEFGGFFTDDETRDIFADPGTVHGYLENNIVVFSKWYPCAWQIHDDGSIELFKDQPSHEICYRGDAGDNSFSGEWEIPAAFVDEDGSYVDATGKGTWSMYKIL